MIGPPGSGKTMLARRLPGILPEMGLDEALEVTKIYSIAGLLKPGVALIRRRPIRSPHHTTSMAGLAGEGRMPRPGEVSQSRHGVLFRYHGRPTDHATSVGPFLCRGAACRALCPHETPALKIDPHPELCLPCREKVFRTTLAYII